MPKAEANEKHANKVHHREMVHFLGPIHQKICPEKFKASPENFKASSQATLATFLEPFKDHLEISVAPSKAPRKIALKISRLALKFSTQFSRNH